MGGAVSSGNDNAELVDNLCHEAYITQPEVEKVFRSVDRADFMAFQEDDDRLEAYEDRAWRRKTLHISAPCIYTKAMEALELKKGLSFLNIGSGTGYLSTMAGLILGSSGANHGVELCPENVEFAHEKVAQFKSRSEWYDPVHFCEPVFLVGNGLLLAPGHMQYDRMYCGAACPPEHVHLMKSLLKVGGILVLPVDNKLEKVQRVAESEWTESVILPSVSFASLCTPTDKEMRDLLPVEFTLQPHLLKDLCRLAILTYLERERYGHVPLLPLPKHLQEYVGHYQEWKPPPPSMQLLCDGSNRERDASRKPQSVGSASNKLPNSASAVSVNGRRMFFCSVNGVIIQIPIDSDGSGEENGECESADGESTDGEGVDGESADGEGADGEGVDGESADGEGADGEGVDGEGGSDDGGEDESMRDIEATGEAERCSDSEEAHLQPMETDSSATRDLEDHQPSSPVNSKPHT